MVPKRKSPPRAARGEYILTKWCAEMSAWVKGANERVKGTEVARFAGIKAEGVDWLAVAIGNLGGPRPAAKKVGVAPQTIYLWLQNGLLEARFKNIVKLSEKGDVPLEYLARRLGPWDRPYILPTGQAIGE